MRPPNPARAFVQALMMAKVFFSSPSHLMLSPFSRFGIRDILFPQLFKVLRLLSALEVRGDQFGVLKTGDPFRHPALPQEPIIVTT